MIYFHLFILTILTLITTKGEFVAQIVEENQLNYSSSILEKEERFPQSVNLNSYNFSHYNSMKKIESFLKSFTEKHNDISRLKVFGRSHEDRPLYAVEISSSPSCLSFGYQNDTFTEGRAEMEIQCSKKMIIMDCGIHAREWASIAFCVYFINELITGYKSNKKDIKEVLEKYNFLIIPVFNPDGYVHSQTKVRFWRKNGSRLNDSDCFSVDLNRNFFGTCKVSPCSENYCGEKPLSEPETASFARLLKEKSGRLKAYFTIHTYGQLWMTPWAKTKTEQPKNYNELTRVAKIGADAIRRAFGTQFLIGSTAILLESVSGSSMDFVYDKGYVDYAFALELRDAGKFKFLLPPDQILPLCEETSDGIVAATLAMK